MNRPLLGCCHRQVEERRGLVDLLAVRRVAVELGERCSRSSLGQALLVLVVVVELGHRDVDAVRWRVLAASASQQSAVLVSDLTGQDDIVIDKLTER